MRKKYNILEFNAIKRCICYMGYIINLAVQSFLFHVDSDTLESSSDEANLWIYNATIEQIKM
jgi:hypothetical protein